MLFCPQKNPFGTGCVRKMEFPESNQFEGPPSQDKIEMKSNAKGELQAEVRIGGDLSSNESADEIIKRQDYIWKQLKSKFPNLKFKDDN